MAFLLTTKAAEGTPGSTGAFVRTSHIGDVDITGSLTVTSLIATTTITTGDNCITLNDDVVGAPTEDAGIEIERGTSLNAEIKWDETGDRWQAGEAGFLSNIVREVDLTSLDSSIAIVGSDFSANFPSTVKVSINDTTAGFLLGKVTAGTGVILTEINDAGDEDLEIAIDPSGVAQNAFTTVTTPFGTPPLADGPTDTLVFTSTDSSVVVTGNQGSDTVDFAVDDTQVDHLNIASIGVNSHAQIDTHIASTSNPHSTTFTQAVTADAGTNITAAEAETLTDGSNADALHVHVVGALAGAKEVFFASNSITATYNNYRVENVTSNGSALLNFSIPFDFVTLTSLELIFAPASAGATGVGKDVDLFSDYGQPGESVTNTSESDTTSTYDFGANADYWVAVDVSSVFTGIGANDLCGMLWDNNGVGGTIRILGIKLKYTT